MAESGNASFLVASVQATPVFLNRAACIEKACSLISKVGKAGAKLAIFPEGFIPTYPVWTWYIPPFKSQILRELYAEMVDNSVTVPSQETAKLCDAAAKAGVNVVIGVNERNSEASGTTLFNTLLFIGSDGTLLGKHRKMVPTSAERLVHAWGDGSTLKIYDLSIGRLSGLICWENYMPLARYAMYAWGAQLYAAPTWDRGEVWVSTLRHIAKEGRVYVISCCTPMKRSDIPDCYAFKKEFLPETEWLNPGESAIVDPDGKFLVEPVRNREEILYAKVETEKMKGPRCQFDVAGHYGRPDIFELRVNRKKYEMIQVFDISPEEGSAHHQGSGEDKSEG